MKKVMIGFGLFLVGAQAFAQMANNYNDYQVNSYFNGEYSGYSNSYSNTYSNNYNNYPAMYSGTHNYQDNYQNSSVCTDAITRDLRMGSSNSEVSTLQDYLHDSGYLDATPNGYFGAGTRKAVMLFERDHNLIETGRVGSETSQELNEAICGGDNTTISTVARTTQIPTTYVSQTDPFITTNTFSPNYNSNRSQVTIGNGTISIPSTPALPQPNTSLSPNILPIVPATSQIEGSRIINNGTTGYTVGITQKPSTITVTSPLVSARYKEGDTITVTWVTSNLNANGYQISLENPNGQNKQITITSGNSATILLSKELLDSICNGSCTDNQQDTFRVVVATPVTDIAGVTTNFRAVVSPITIKRATEFLGGVTITATKSPVSSGEAFKLYTSIPTGTLLNGDARNFYSFKIRAICPSNVSVSIAGTPCGVDLPVPFDAPFYNQQIPVTATNTSWYRQDVTFELSVVGINGVILKTSQTKVTIDPNPFNW